MENPRKNRSDDRESGQDDEGNDGDVLIGLRGQGPTGARTVLLDGPWRFLRLLRPPDFGKSSVSEALGPYAMELRTTYVLIKGAWELRRRQRKDTFANAPSSGADAFSASLA